jgi:ParB family chromosome partitioning protein
MARVARGADASVVERPARAAKADANLTAVETRLRERLGTRVQIQRRGGKGAIHIEFYSEDDLERLLRLIGVGA